MHVTESITLDRPVAAGTLWMTTTISVVGR